jgi:Ni/Fe-hydrogenase 1 B-type cytochrome subunit
LSVFSSVFLPMNTPAPVFDRLISVSTKPGQVQFLGNRYARWDQFIPVTKARWRNVLESLQFYLFLRRKPAPAVGHDGLDGLIFAVRFLIDFVIIFTGFAMYSRFTSYKSPLALFHVLLPLFGGFQHTRWLHHVMMWVVIAFILQHITS